MLLNCVRLGLQEFIQSRAPEDNMVFNPYRPMKWVNCEVTYYALMPKINSRAAAYEIFPWGAIN